jgi:glycerate 2-kinase
MMKIVVAPDSFKGSLSAKDICKAVKMGAEKVFPDADVLEVPLADGGEGTMENMVYASGGKTIEVTVKGPLGLPVRASYGVLNDQKTAVIEMAQASGLPLLNVNERNPFKATSFGTGELIKDALNKGYRQFLVAIGGSATNDAGTGMLKALGMKFYDDNMVELPEGGGYLSLLHHYDDSGLDERIKESSFLVASDVNNKLCGENGASVIFAPQKGADAEMVSRLDTALNRFADVVYAQSKTDMREINGGGAAGGMGAALVTFLNAELRSGIDLMMKEIHFQELLSDADLVITGEGSLDMQTLEGKVIKGVADAAGKQGIPVIALTGNLNLPVNKFDSLGIVSAFSVVPGPCSLETAFANGSEWITDRTVSILRLLKAVTQS